MSQQATPYPAVSDTLRAELDRRRTSGQRFDLRAAVALVVPVCTRLVELHDAGTRLFVHPSSVRFGQGPPAPDPQLGAALPEHPADRACVAPEARRGQPGDARASVFSVGAILYEMITGASVGPGMRRPAELVPGLPQSVELVLGKALVGDPAHRPADLGALAQALHNLAPTASIPPPPADESHLDQDAGFEVDVSLSMLPPESVARGKVALGIYYGQTPVAAPAPTPAPAPEPTLGDSGIRTSTERLAQLKASLEADPRPRYIVIKDGMDHGPFTAVELLQQIAQSSFTGEMTLRDALSTEEQLLGAWEQFSPFVEQAGLRRKSQDEKKALDVTVAAEKQKTQYKVMGGAVVLILMAAAGLGWWLRERRAQRDELAVTAQQAQSIDVAGGLKGPKKGPGGGPWKGGGSGEGGVRPVLPGGLSCEQARDRYVEEYNLMSGDNKTPPDLTQGAYAAVLNRGSYLNACGVPGNMGVNICAAVQNGRAVGVTVTTSPPSGGTASCIAGQIRAMSFPVHPRLDIAYTQFKPE